MPGALWLARLPYAVRSMERSVQPLKAAKRFRQASSAAASALVCRTPSSYQMFRTRRVFVSRSQTASSRPAKRSP